MESSTQPDGAEVAANPFAERAAAEARAKAQRPSLLSAITRNKRRRPLYGVIYGPHGVGKSTFGSRLPNPVFLQLERGLDQLTIDRFPMPQTLREYAEQIQALRTEPHDYESIILDTVDGLNVLVERQVCEEGHCDSIEDYRGGYGKGFTRCRELFIRILERLTEMSEKWNILLLGHAQIKTITDPALGAPYDMWRMRLPDKSQDVIKQSVDLLLFASLRRTLDKESPKARKGRAIISDDRELWTMPATGIEAKNRFGLPPVMEFSWEALSAAIENFYK